MLGAVKPDAGEIEAEHDAPVEPGAETGRWIPLNVPTRDGKVVAHGIADFDDDPLADAAT